MRWLFAALLLLGCTHPAPVEAHALPPNEPVKQTDAARPPVVETVVEDDDEWLDSFHWKFDPDPACRWSAQCWRAPKTPPTEPAKAPFAECRATMRTAPLDDAATRKGRTDLAKDACCYLGRMCKLPKKSD